MIGNETQRPRIESHWRRNADGAYASARALDTTYDVVAPENTAFSYRVAGPFLRALAFMIDLIAMFFYFLGTTLGGAYLMVKLDLDSDFAENVAFALILFNVLFVFWFWNAIWEACWSGRTLGKACCGLRVLSTSGRAISGQQAIIRNILRTVDLFLGPFDVLIMSANDRMARLGDLATGTVVVNERSQKRGVMKATFNENLVATIASNIPEDFSVSESTFQALSLYVSRRLEISPSRRYEIASGFASALARKCHFPYRVDPDAFLCAVYTRALKDLASV